ncbi:neuroparsin-A-like [Penaeus chinensis]|uniref:neuroparsin-A-like n=1 Tax=Penaeus chinensis TaxID=139456 RepID=UPI001FB59B3C|nr:neuroparsin-A-like [Penaeus chinensis]
MARFVSLPLACALWAIAARSCIAVTCNCNSVVCAPIVPSDCPVGTAKDMCKCCSVCAGDLGEDCGGPWGIYGDCGAGLECHQETCPEDKEDAECFLYYLTEPGKCQEKRRRSLLDLLGGDGSKGLQEIRERRRLRLLHELENLRRK